MASKELLCGNPPFLACIFGKKHSGKTVLIKYLCYKYRTHFNYIVVISPTACMNTDYDYIPKEFIHNSYSPKLITDIIDKQANFKNADKKVHMLLILDDIASDPNINFKKTKFTELTKIFSANRHYNISAIFVGHTMKTLPKMLRGNCDYAFITKVLASSMDDLYEEYGHLVKREFKEFIAHQTVDFQMILYNNRSNAGDPFICFKIPPNFCDFKFKLNY